MRWNSSLAVVPVFLLVLVIGCGQPKEVGKSSIPVIKGARFVKKDVSGAMMGESARSLKNYTFTTWHFNCKSISADEVLAFYKSQYPQADHYAESPASYADLSPEEMEEESIVLHELRSPIGGPGSDEDIEIAIGDGFFWVTESTLD